MVKKPAPSAPFGSQVFMMKGSTPVSITTQSKDYTGSRQALGKRSLMVLLPRLPLVLLRLKGLELNSLYGPLPKVFSESLPIIRTPVLLSIIALLSIWYRRLP